MSIDRKNLTLQLNGEDYDIKGERCGLQNYNMNHMIRSWADLVDDDDLLLQKIQLEAEAELKYGN